MSYIIQKGKKLNSLMGFKGLVSNHTLYGAAANTYSYKDASMWTLTQNINVKGEIIGIEIHTTYFKPTPQVLALRKHIEKLNEGNESGQKIGLSQDEAIKFFE